MKKLLTIALTVAALFAGTTLSAQGKWGADSAECIKFLSYYKEYYKQKSYDDATPNWRQAYHFCPATANQNMLIDGTTLIKRLIEKNASNPEYRAALVDTLMTLYQVRADNYPKYAVTALNNKGIDMNKYIKDDYRALYEGYNAIIAANGSNSKPQFFLFDLNAAIELFKLGELSAEEVIENYQSGINYLDAATPKNDIEAEQIQSVKNDMGSTFAACKVASCDHLLELYGPKLAADPDNYQLAGSIVKTMGMTDDCINNELFLKAVTVVYNNKPTASAAYSLYKLNSIQDNVDDAIKYLEEAIASEDSDAATDAQYMYELASYCYSNGKVEKAYDTAGEVAKGENAFAGKSYYLMGIIWSQMHCGGNEITSKANFWAAVDFFAKAKAADPSLAEDCNRYIGRYSSNYPDKADAFMYNLQSGQAYTVSCGGISARTTVKTR